MTPDPIKQAGDSALLLELGVEAIDPGINARTIAVARAVRRCAIPGVRDVVSTFRSVAVFFEPLATDVDAVAAALHDAARAPSIPEAGRSAEIPVVYGGDAGPDLERVAEFGGCTPAAVIERHCARRYRVYMLGFLPGFPYMAHVDQTIAAPRHATPRLGVPAGSVGIAGMQTGIYPRESPGGWQIIGRTAVKLFDPDQTPPALLAPGDDVKFVPAHDLVTSDVGGPESHAPVAMDTSKAARSLTVLRPGLLTTVQDSGRWGYQGLGVPVAGPMDAVAHRTVNMLVGNQANAATLEMTLGGPELRMEQETRIAVGGADFIATLDGVELPRCIACDCRRNSVLRFGDRRRGTRAYVAVDGGIAVDAVLNSRATHVRSGLGGIGGRALRPGDRLPLGEAAKDRPRVARAPQVATELVGGARLRVLPGPQADHFDQSTLSALQRMRFTISARSDRMGYRLTGARIPRSMRGDMVSDVAFMGALQVPPSGDPILLMADRQTTGGYPQLAIVISADLPAAGQLGPGDWVEFEVCRRDEAIAALVAAEVKLLAVR